MKPMPKNIVYLIIGFSVFKFLLHLAANASYGLHADELYYIALSKHLQWGYLDNSPLIAVITAFSRFFFGESTFAYRILPTLFSALTVSFTGLITYYLGGKRLAVAIACTAMLCSPAFLATAYFLQPVDFEQFFWTAGLYCTLRYVQTREPVFIYACGLLLGLGLLNKYTILLYSGAIIACNLFIIGHKKLKKSFFLWAAFICLLVILPNMIWQVQHHFPVFKYVHLVHQHPSFHGMGDYLFQFSFFHGSAVAVWLAGVSYLLLKKSLRPYRFVAWAFVITCLLLFILQGKIYYGLGAFPAVIAAGGVCWEEMLNRTVAFWRYNLFVILILPALIALPAVVPLLPFPLTVRYFKLMSTYTYFTEPLTWEDGRVHPIPQFYADMLGWQELARKVTAIYQKLTPEERKHTVIWAEQYPAASAISYYGGRQLPPVVSANNSFILWSPKELDAQTVIFITRPETDTIRPMAKNVMLADSLTSAYARERGIRIYLMQQPSERFKQAYTKQRSRFTE